MTKQRRDRAPGAGAAVHQQTERQSRRPGEIGKKEGAGGLGVISVRKGVCRGGTRGEGIGGRRLGGGGKPEMLTVDIVRRESWFGLSTDSGQRETRRCDARAVAKVGRTRCSALLYLYLREREYRGGAMTHPPIERCAVMKRSVARLRRVALCTPH